MGNIQNLITCKVGEAVKCYYSAIGHAAYTSNTFGSFNFDSGTESPISTILSIYTDNNYRNDCEFYYDINGYFYFIKVSDTLFIADRIVNKRISRNIVYANINRQLEATGLLYQFGMLSYNDWRNHVHPGGRAKWNGLSFPVSRQDVEYYWEYQVVLEMLTDTVNGKMRTIGNFDLSQIDGGNHFREATYYHPDFWNYTPVYQRIDAPMDTYWYGGGGTTRFNLYGYRPTLLLEKIYH